MNFLGPNISGGIARGVATGNALREFQRGQERDQLFAEHGPGIMAGDPTALEAMGRIDPVTGLAIKNQLATAGRADEMHKAQLAQIAQNTKIQAERWAREQDAATVAALAAKLDAALSEASAAYQQGPEAFNMWAKQNAQRLEAAGAGGLTYETAPIAITGVVGWREGLKSGLAAADGFKPGDPADEYGRYVQEERAAGRQPLSRIDYAQAKKGKGTVVYDPQTGRPLVSIGGGASDPGDVTDPSSTGAMVSTIEGILQDPAFDTSTGIFSFLQSVPGTPQRRFGSRVAQLDGQAFLQAFESLKGGGHITEIEGQKATQAIGRLDSAMFADDYRDALTELRDLANLGLSRKRAAEGASVIQPSGDMFSREEIDNLSDDDLLQMDLTKVPTDLRSVLSDRFNQMASGVNGR